MHYWPCKHVKSRHVPVLDSAVLVYAELDSVCTGQICSAFLGQLRDGMVLVWHWHLRHYFDP